MIDVDAVRAWRQANDREAALLQVAHEVPAILARATNESFAMVEGADKRRMAGVLAGAWFVSTTALLDYLRTVCPAPELTHIPPEIERLRKIARD